MGLTSVGLALAVPAVQARSDIEKPELELVWSIDGGPFGSSRSLEQTLAIGSDAVFVSGNATKGDRRHQIIRTFDIKTGRPLSVIEHPDGEPFQGFGEAIGLNNRFLVTALHRKGRSRRGGELLVYDSTTLKLLRRIKSPHAADATFFGLNGVELVGDRILASSTLGAGNKSTAWVFSAETGETLLTINDPDAPPARLGKTRPSFFGRALAMNATHIAITANARTGPTGLNAQTIVYVFDARDGALLYRLKPLAASNTSAFGGALTISEDRLYVTALTETGELNWPTGIVHAYDLATGELQYSVSDPSVPENLDEFSAGSEGWGFPTSLSSDGSFLLSGLPNWRGRVKDQGGVSVLDARTGEWLTTYGNANADEWSQFGLTIAAQRGYLAVMQKIPGGGPGAMRLMLFKVKTP